MKTCNKCGLEKPATHYGKDKRNKDGLQGICEECRTANKATKRYERAIGIGVSPVKEKTCNKCGITKEAEMFFRDTGFSDGRASICKECKTVKSLEWREKNRDQYNATMRTYHKQNYGRLRLGRYKLSESDYSKMLFDQKGLCAMCSSPPPAGKKLVIDHEHKTGKVRGLLCYGCNRILHVFDTEDKLKAANAFLAKHKD